MTFSKYQWQGMAVFLVAGLLSILSKIINIEMDLVILMLAFYGGYVFNTNEKTKNKR